MKELEVAILETRDSTKKTELMLAHLASRVNEHHTTLFGNGKPGLQDDVLLLKDAQGRRDRWITGIGIGAAVAFAKSFFNQG